MGWRERLPAWDALVRHISLVLSIIERSKQIVPRLVIYHQKAGTFFFSEMLNLFSLECWVKVYKRMKLIGISFILEGSSDQYNTWNESIEIPEIWLDFTILQRVANKLFRNESYMTRKFNILVFQSCFSYFHWNVERESRRLWTVSFSSDQLFFEQEMTPGAYNTPGTPLWDTSLEFLLNDRAVQTNCSETCYISIKRWEFPLFRNATLAFIGMSSENLQKNEIDTFQRPIPEINRLKFPKFDLMLPFYNG